MCRCVPVVLVLVDPMPMPVSRHKWLATDGTPRNDTEPHPSRFDTRSTNNLAHDPCDTLQV